MAFSRLNKSTRLIPYSLACLTLAACTSGSVRIGDRYFDSERYVEAAAAYEEYLHDGTETREQEALTLFRLGLIYARSESSLYDRPVSNSGRLRQLITEIVSKRSAHWEVSLTDRTDQTLIVSPDIVATADSAILDRCNRWFNLARTLVEEQIPDAWVVDLGRQDPAPAKEQP